MWSVGNRSSKDHWRLTPLVTDWLVDRWSNWPCKHCFFPPASLSRARHGPYSALLLLPARRTRERYSISAQGVGWAERFHNCTSRTFILGADQRLRVSAVWSICAAEQCEANVIEANWIYELGKATSYNQEPSQKVTQRNWCGCDLLQSRMSKYVYTEGFFGAYNKPYLPSSSHKK